MGGLIIVVMWPMILPIAILYFLDIALNLFAPILLGLNIAGLAGLLLVRWLWKRTGTMDREYLSAQPDWKRILFTVVKYGLLLFILWEVLLVLLCGAWMFWGHELLFGI